MARDFWKKNCHHCNTNDDNLYQNKVGLTASDDPAKEQISARELCPAHIPNLLKPAAKT